MNVTIGMNLMVDLLQLIPILQDQYFVMSILQHDCAALEWLYRLGSGKPLLAQIVLRRFLCRAPSAQDSESECKNRTIQMRVRRAHSAQMPMIGADIDVAGTPTMSSLSTQEGTMTKTSIPAVSNASSAAADDVVTALFPAPRRLSVTVDRAG